MTVDCTGNRLPSDLSCQLYYEDGSSVIAQLEENPKPIGYGWFVNSKPVREYIFTCPCPVGQLPTFVSLKRSTAQQTDISCLPVEVKDYVNFALLTFVFCGGGVVKVTPIPLWSLPFRNRKELTKTLQ